jgi:imidazolonepropionase-like amidohydrolase
MMQFLNGYMHNAGVVVAYNSDDAEMSRRLNQEAAKAVKYGDISEEEAWKFVTLNPAKLCILMTRK